MEHNQVHACSVSVYLHSYTYRKDTMRPLSSEQDKRPENNTLEPAQITEVLLPAITSVVNCRSQKSPQPKRLIDFLRGIIQGISPPVALQSPLPHR